MAITKHQIQCIVRDVPITDGVNMESSLLQSRIDLSNNKKEEIKMKNWSSWVLSGIVVFISFQLVYAIYIENSRLRWQLKIAESVNKISDDQINDLMSIVYNLKAEKESIATQNFVAGVVDTIKNKEYYSEIWHDGYNRGGLVAEYAAEIKPLEGKIEQTANRESN